MFRRLKRLLYGAGVLVVLVAAALWLGVRASLPQLAGERAIPGLAAPVEIERDASGVVTVKAADRVDLARATGFVHAQERFFQMDLLRRSAAGELSELVGEGTLGLDLERRLHRLRPVAREALAQASPEELALLEAYAEGVNAGLDALLARPFEYLVLGGRPRAWRPEDTFLVVHAMYFELHDELALREERMGRLHRALPPAMFEFLTQGGTSWDAPMQGEPFPELAPPGPEVCDLFRAERPSLARATGGRPAREEDEAIAGSNAWAVGSRRVRGGRGAVLANDMHLFLRMPNIWFRMRLVVHGPDGEALDVTGVTLPGTMAVVAGSNGHVAWGFSNSYGDWVDRVVLEMDPVSPGRYRTAEGYRSLETHVERIKVKGSEDRLLEVSSTIWGPVLPGERGGDGSPQALEWLAHHPRATNLGLLALEGARDVHEALAMAPRMGIPPQNIVLADAEGNIAWTVAGRMPRRRGYDPRIPSSWAEPGRGWFGWLAKDDYPVIVNHPSASVWTANARVVSGADMEKIGDGGLAFGARARQIRDSLALLEDATALDMLPIALDDRALWLERWRSLLLARLADPASMASQERMALRDVVAAWDGRAKADAAGFRLVRAFRGALHDAVFSAIVHGCGALGPDFRYLGMPQSEGALWRLVQDRPRHLLDPRHDSWDALLDEAVDTALASCASHEPAQCTWGEINPVHIRHPLSAALPILSPWLDIGPMRLAGGVHVPRVQIGTQGASERFAVAPGDEKQGYFHMPGGQSGHPLSPFYRAGHDAWAEGRPAPFLPGPAVHRLTLLPAAAPG